MIPQLTKLDYPSWKNGVVFFAILLAVLFMFIRAGSGSAASGVSAAGAAVYLSLLGPNQGRRCTSLTASLPIRGRDIFLARLLVNLVGAWLVFLTIIAAIPSSREAAKGQAAVFVFGSGAIVTLGVMCIHSVRIQEFSAPRWWQRVVGVIAMITLALAWALTDHKSPPVVLTICTFVFCALASAALFLRLWASIPESFQIAPIEPVLPKSRDKWFRLPSFSWLPILRALFSTGTLSLYTLSLLAGVLDQQFLGVASVCLAITTTNSRIRRADQWLLSLPISRQKLFLPIVLAPLAAFTLGRMFHSDFDFSQQTARPMVVDLIAVAATSLLAVSVTEIPSFARRLRSTRVFLLTSAALFALCYFVWRWLHPVTGANRMRTTAMDIWLGGILPVRFPSLILSVVAIVGAVYWLAYEGFRCAEVQRGQGPKSPNGV